MIYVRSQREIFFRFHRGRKVTYFNPIAIEKIVLCNIGERELENNGETLDKTDHTQTMNKNKRYIHL